MKSDSSNNSDDDEHPITLNSFAKATHSMVRSNNKTDQRFIDLSRLNQARRHGIKAGFDGFVADPYSVDFLIDTPNSIKHTKIKM